jgi:hypothetical protein
VELYGNNLEKRDIQKYIGDISQIADAREGMLTSGKADGVRVIDVKNGGGLSFSVVPSRGMDIAWAEFKGIPLSFISKTGMVGPSFFEKDGLNFLRSFYCGLVTTCGLTYMGAPCEDQGELLGLHGRISNTPAQDVFISKEWEENDYVIRIRGKIKESSVFSENLLLTREISTKMGEKTLHIHDVVENCGFDEQPLMLLYHCNFGYPVISEDTRLIQPEGNKVRARDAEAEKGIAEYNRFQSPTHGYSEQVFYHDLPAMKNGETYSCLYNSAIHLGAYVRFDKTQFPHFGEWKMMGEGDYAVGLEPSICYPEGRKLARERNQLSMIQPGERRKFDCSIGVVESQEEIEALDTELRG